MDDCVELARAFGARIAERFDIPVYLYAEAATRPERRVLSDIRKPQFEGLAALIGSLAYQPDFGPARVHPSAGAVAVGARPFLIAYNINLESDDLALAKRIASTIRERNGGLPRVQALGLFLEDLGMRAGLDEPARPHRHADVARLGDRQGARRGRGCPAARVGADRAGAAGGIDGGGRPPACRRSAVEARITGRRAWLRSATSGWRARWSCGWPRLPTTGQAALTACRRAPDPRALRGRDAGGRGPRRGAAQADAGVLHAAPRPAALSVAVVLTGIGAVAPARRSTSSPDGRRRHRRHVRDRRCARWARHPRAHRRPHPPAVRRHARARAPLRQRGAGYLEILASGRRDPLHGRADAGGHRG